MKEREEKERERGCREDRELKKRNGENKRENRNWDKTVGEER